MWRPTNALCGGRSNGFIPGNSLATEMTDSQGNADRVGRRLPSDTASGTVFRVRRPSLQDEAESQSVPVATPPENPELSSGDFPRNEDVPSEQFDVRGPRSAPREAATRPPALSPLAERPELRVQEAARASIARNLDRAAYVVGTFDTKGRELNFVRSRLSAAGLRTVTVDLGTSERPSGADIGPREVARCHPQGPDAVFTGDRGTAVAAMAEAFSRFLVERRDLGGVISAGGSGATALATPAMQRLDVGIPKVMVSTVASGDVKPYVGPTDICMMYAVTDVQGLNRISRRVLTNAANALAGMIAQTPDQRADDQEKPAIGLTMFGVTTPCVQAVTYALQDRYDCLVFHATGTGGQSMEKLVDSGLLTGVIDATTTEIADFHLGGVMSAGEDRLGAIIRAKIPYVGSCGALDMVNWGAMDTVPEKFRERKLYAHNPQVTLMRTTARENDAMGRWIARKLNQCEGPVRFLIPEGGVSLLDAPDADFWDPDADRALFAAIEEEFMSSANRRLVHVSHNINEPEFARVLVDNFLEIVGGSDR